MKNNCNIEIHKYNELINSKFIEWLIYMIGYAIVLITVSVLFSSFEINNKYFDGRFNFKTNI